MTEKAIDGLKSDHDFRIFIKWKEVDQIVDCLQRRIVKAVKDYCRVLHCAFSMLEPSEAKVSRRVLRGGMEPQGSIPTRHPPTAQSPEFTVRLQNTTMIKKVILMVGILGTIMGFFGSGKASDNKYEIADIYMDLRNKVLHLNPSEIGLSPSDSNRVWGVLMETGYTDAVVTLVTIADGSVSLYFSNGGGIIGVGEHDGPRKACTSFLSIAPKFIEYAKPTIQFPLPKEGNTRFYFMTYDGIFSIETLEDDLGNERLPLSPLFLEGHEVISQARIVDDQLETSFQNFMHAVTTGDKIGVKRLLNEGFNPNRSDKTGLSPLMAAAYKGKDDILKCLIEHKSDIEGKDESGYTALMFASNAGHAKSAKILIKSGADVNTLGNDGSTPIMFAAQNGNNELVSLLLANGADPKIEGNHGLSAIGFAKQNGHKETIKLLLGH